MSKWLVAALAVQAVMIGGLLTIALDLQAHKRVERLGGVNVWGYRGPVMPSRQHDEIRIAVVGGDFAFGWGVAAGETLAPTLRRLVLLVTDQPGRPLRPVTAVNLGATRLAVGAYASWIEHFAYLQPDIVCIVIDPRRRDMGGVSLLPDRESTAFRVFGYAPILPLVVREKGALTRSWLLRTIGSAAAGVDHVVARALTHAGADGGAESGAAYAEAIGAAARSALRIGAGVVVVAPPYADDREAPDHEALADMMSSHFAEERRIRFVDLGDEPEIYDAGFWLPEMAFSAAGHERVAEYVAPLALDLLVRR